MAANANWRRWIHASIAKYLKEVADDNDIPSLVEGLEDRSKEFMESPDRVEIRVNGPFTQELSAGYYRIQVDVNVLLTSHMEGAVKNAHRLNTNLGIFHNAMDGVISILRLGTGPDDDQDAEFCIAPRPGKSDSIRVIDFGQIDKTDRIRQGVVDARYVGYASE
jgi:hypothetical protein